jgi:hypothetical protein
LKAETISEARQKVENPDDVSNFEQLLIAEAQVAQRLPVLARHPRRRCAHFFGDMTERADARRQTGRFSPSMLLDRVYQLRVPAFDTQKLCVGLRSVVAILGRGGHRRDHLALGPRKRARREHHLREQLRQRRADQRMGVHQH